MYENLSVNHTSGQNHCLSETSPHYITGCDDFFLTSSRSVHVEHVAIVLVIHFSSYLSTRRGGARALKFWAQVVWKICLVEEMANYRVPP